MRVFTRSATGLFIEPAPAAPIRAGSTLKCGLPVNLLLVAVLILSVTAGVFVSSCKSRRARPNALRLNIGTEPPSLDWSLATDSASIQVLENIMEGLARFDDSLVARPALASEWKVSDDGLVYTFRIRDDVKWTDGVALTARHFVDGWRRLLDPTTAAEYAYFLYDVNGAEEYNSGKTTDFSTVGVRAIDDHTLEVKLKNPVVYFPSVVTFISTFPIRLDVIEKWGDGWTEPGRIVTLGPYKLESWKHEYRLTLARNDVYYGEAPQVDKVEMFMVGEPNTALDLYDAGALDIVSVPPHAIPYYNNRPDYRSQLYFAVFYLGFNVTKPPFDNPLVRRAFSHSIDREQVVKVLQGGYQPWAGWIPPGMTASNESVGCKFDPQLARKLLEQAGYKSQENFPEVTLGYNKNLSNRMVVSNVQEQWRVNLKIEVRLNNMEWKVYLRQLRDDTPQVFRLGWVADYPDPDNFMKMFISTSGNNHTHWGNPEFDRLVEVAAFERDPAKRKKLYDKAQHIMLVEDCAIVPLFASKLHRLVTPRVKGFKLNMKDLLFLDRISIEVGEGVKR